MPFTKEDLRKVFLTKRRELTDEEYLEFNYQIYYNFFNYIKFYTVKVLHVFLPIQKNKEPNTWLIINRIRRDYAHVRISVPRVNSETGEMESFFYEGTDQLAKNSWGILEPRHGVPTKATDIDMVLVPMLIFDTNGNRVGYGKGFYDKFLTSCKPACTTVGLSFFEPVDIIADADKHDVPLKSCITPTRLWEF